MCTGSLAPDPPPRALDVSRNLSSGPAVTLNSTAVVRYRVLLCSLEHSPQLCYIFWEPCAACEHKHALCEPKPLTAVCRFQSSMVLE